MSNTTVKPKIFIGSSVEGLPIARGVQANLQRDAEVTVWDQNVFKPSSYTMESLMERLEKSDFAVLVLSPDDIAKSRKRQFKVPRDNVIFELGLFMGRLTKEHVFFLVPHNHKNFHLPSDLTGIKSIEFEDDRTEPNWQAATAVACDQMRPALIQMMPSVVRTQTEILDDIMKQLRILLERQLSTEYVGAFPVYLDKNINPCLAEAQRDIYILCDRVPYGAFSAPDAYSTYMRILKEKRDMGIKVHLIALNQVCRMQLAKGQFRQFYTDDKFKETLDRDEVFENHVLALSTRARMQIANHDEFLEALSVYESREVDKARSLFLYTELDQIFPIHIWIADSKRAVFSIPSYTDVTLEQGFASSDANLINCLLSIWNHYSITQSCPI
jgi:Predicted nucleotide-binding protein containing TIR-like domain